MPYEETIECPLCMEPLDIDDLNFYPCTCGYQVCRFCWHRIRTDENSLCPACRKQYQEDPAEFKPLTEEELTKIKKERRQKDAARKQKAAENRRHLANIRVVQKNLVFVVGLSNRLADAEVLKRQEYFGKYGKIVKVVINSSTSYAGAQGPSASAYITYTRPEDCLRAIQAVNNLYVDGRTLKASLGTTKYCSHFLKGTQCAKADCMYLHELGEDEASFTKEEMQAGKHQDYEQKLVEQYLTPQVTQPSTNTQTTNRSTPVNGPPTTPSIPETLSSTTTGSGGIAIVKPPSSRKKTDSGSSGGSGKSKEPWPLLGTSNRNQSNINPDNDTDTVIQDSTLEDTAIKDHRSSPETNGSVKHNGYSHSPQSSISSSISNPRTPTPDTSGAPSPKLPDTTSVSVGQTNDKTQNSDTDSTAVISTSPCTMSGTAQLQTNTTDTTNLLAARKLPFGDMNGTQLQTDQNNDYLDLLHGSNSLDSLQFTGLSKEIDSILPTVSNSLPNWQSPFGYTLTSDDDLGFDPFLESNKALADMLENECGQHISPLPSHFSPLVRTAPPPGVPLPAHIPATSTGLFSDGIMSAVVPPMLPVVTSSSSPLPPPPPGLSGFPQFPSSSASSNTPDMLGGMRGSRMLGLMNLGQSAPHQNQSMMPSSPMNTLPNRSFYNSDPRLSSTYTNTYTSSNAYSSGLSNGLGDMGSCNTQDLKESLKALLPNVSINFAPSVTTQQQQSLQHSRLRNNYMTQNSQPPALNHSTSWNGTPSSNIDDQFLDPAIITGCLSSDNTSNPGTLHQNWIKSFHHIADNDMLNKQTSSSHMIHSQSHPQGFRSGNMSHSRMPFAQNLHMSQPASSSGWPPLQQHNPPPGFQSAFRSSSQNPRLTTLEG